MAHEGPRRCGDLPSIRVEEALDSTRVEEDVEDPSILQADLEAVPLGPIPRKRRRAPVAAVAEAPKQPAAAGGEADAMMEAYGDAYGA